MIFSNNYSTTRNIINLIMLPIFVLGLLMLFAFLLYQVYIAIFVPPPTFEEWESECKKNFFSTERGVATYMGTYHDNRYWICLVIQSNRGEVMFIDRSVTDLIPRDWRNVLSYEGLSFPIKYVVNNPHNYWIFYENPIHEESPMYVTNGTIIGVAKVHHLVRVRLSFEIETDYKKIRIVEQQYLPLKYLRLCRKLKREKKKVLVKLFTYAFDENIRVEKSFPRTDVMPSKMPDLKYIPHRKHPWIACVELDSLSNQ